MPIDYDVPSEEYQYLTLIRRILAQPTSTPGRNGATRTVFGDMMRFSLKDGTWPLLTTKRVAWKTCAHELFWFIRGQTSNHVLNARGVHIWDGNASRAFLDSRGLQHYAEGDLGPIYGFQWRHWNSPYGGGERNGGIDQEADVIRQLRDPRPDGARTSRRLLISAWNPDQLDQMALPPCHVMMQLHLRENRYLSCAMYQRSGDVGLGVPFNIASYSLLTHLLAHHCGLEADELVYFLGNAHIYEEHVAPLEEQLQRFPTYPFPRIRFDGLPRDRIEDYDVEDIQWVTTYQHHPTISMNMVP